jgi:anaerobic selenocysteine-containing dehydrogenase/Fe-S-cluster-containing dehydrogenase component
MTTSRRVFLGAAATTVGAGILGCSERQPRYLVPSVVPSDDAIAGISRHYRTACRGCASACGMTVRTREGRVLSVEGSADHPLSRGGLCPQAHASVEMLYSPERFVAPREGSSAIAWEQAEKSLAAGLRKAKDQNKLVVVVTRPERGSTGNALRTWLAALGQQATQVVTFDPLARPWVRDGVSRAFGSDASPSYDLGAAKFVLSIGDDFVEEGSPVEHARGLADMKAAGGRFVYVGPRMSLTAASADEWLSLAPGTETTFVLGLARAVLDLGGAGAPASLRGRLAAYDEASVAAKTGVGAETLRKLAADLAHARPSLCIGPGRAVAGEDASALAEAIFVLNALAGNVGETLKLFPPSQEPWATQSMELAEFVRRANAGDVGAVILHHANPLAYGQVFGALAGAIARVPFVAAFTNVLDESASKAHLALPDHHFLETWSDDAPRAGVTTIQQAVMAPVFETRPSIDVLFAAARALGASLPDGAFGDTVRKAFDEKLLEHGVRVTDAATMQIAIKDDALSSITTPTLKGPADGLPLVVAPSLRHPNGLVPKSELLQEIPDTLSHVSWSGWMELHPATAKKLGAESGDLVSLDGGAGRVELPVFVTTGVREGVVAVPIGYASALFAEGAPALGFGMRVKAQTTGAKDPLFPIKQERSQHGRPLARSVARSSPKLPVVQHPSMYEPVEHPKHRWGLAIDLDRCTGCTACVAACYIENNNAIVGPLEVSRARDMAWLRIQTFVDTSAPVPKATVIPVGCQQCTNAPCEQVCPAYATYHTRDGLNAMVYARCVGTRYCENNCPYSARAFNFFDHPRKGKLPMLLNPDVTVRERGITEKCTFCIQRIRAAEEQAKFEDRPVRDGEIVPACAGTCPSRAIVFGDLKDPDSEVSRWAKDGRAYRLLEELNTQPGVVYLARRRDEAT